MPDAKHDLSYALQNMCPLVIHCQLCPLTFSDESAMSAHYDTAHAQTNSPSPVPSQPDLADQCDTVSPRSEHSCTAHAPTSNSSPPAQPEHSDTGHAETNSQSSPLQSRPERPVVKRSCEVCSITFARMNSLRRHMRTAHSVSDVKDLKCDVCSKYFQNKGNLKTHLSTVHGRGDVRRFLCDVCCKSFCT